MKKKNPKIIIIIVITVIIVSIIGVYFLFKVKKTKPDNTIFQTPKTEIEVKDKQQDNKIALTKEFKNNDHNFSFRYPENWQVMETKGDKNVTEPLKREEIAKLRLPAEKEQATDDLTLVVLRFVIEPERKIKTSDDWYNYIKEKVDKFIAIKDLSEKVGYKLISLNKTDDINGHFAVREDYYLSGDIRGEDFYLYNGKDFYQFVFEVVGQKYDNYTSVIEEIVKSVVVSTSK